MTLRTAAVAASLFAAGCHSPAGQLTGHASDEWVRSYELRPDGEIQVSASNGTIDLEGYDGKTVEVRAARTARASAPRYPGGKPPARSWAAPAFPS